MRSIRPVTAANDDLTVAYPTAQNRCMKTLNLLSAVGCLLMLLCLAVFAQDTPTSPAKSAPAVATSPVAAPVAPNQPGVGTPSQADMTKQMIENSKLNENHKVLAQTAGDWNYTVKFWMNPDPSAKPQESKGTAIRKMIMGGRYLTGEYNGQMQMPGLDGKMKDVAFKGTGMEAYDNLKKKFVATWADNMGTGIMMMEGSYDPATKSFTYTGEEEMMPGMKSQIREVIKLTDKDHMQLEWYENQGGSEKKTMEIAYSRKK
jgi:hypothetical protein